MKKTTLAALAAALILAACAIFTGPGPLVLYAQALPATVHVQWDAPLPSDNVTGYTLILDGGAPITVPNVTDVTCGCVRTPLVVPAFGPHTVTVATNVLFLSTDPTSTITGTPTAPIPFTLAKAGVVANGKVVR